MRRQRQRHCTRWRGDDSLGGGSGNDRLTGGPGADRFSGGSGTDTATDYSAAEGDTSDGTIP
jgi:Ca2+-binding RTX toxin-like protein